MNAFNPARLAIARQRRKLTQRQLAASAGMSSVHLSRVLGGAAVPEQATVQALAAALAYPIEFFFRGDADVPTSDSASFRSMEAMTARERDAALAAGSLAFELDDWVGDRFNLPAPDLVNMSHEPDPATAARSLRQHWGLGEAPVRNMTHLLESKGVRIFSLAEDTKHVDAFSCWRSGVPFVFLNLNKSSEHSRFDAAHELGHLVLHAHGGPKGRAAEREANEFASSFLMPRGDLESRVEFVTSLNQLVQLKRRWGVSVAALAYRLHRLGRISDWNYRSLCIEIARNGYRTAEPEGCERETSSLWSQVLGALWAEKVTKGHIAADLCVPVEEIESLVFGLVASRNGNVEATSATGLRVV